MIPDNFILNLRDSLRILEREIDLELKGETTCCGVTLAQCHIIMEFSHNGNTSISELSEIFGLDKSTLSRTIDGLVEAGLLERTTNKSDRRVYDLNLTEAGKLKSDYINEQCNVYYNRILDNIPTEKHNIIIESLTLLGNAMKTERIKSIGKTSNCCINKYFNKKDKK